MKKQLLLFVFIFYSVFCFGQIAYKPLALTNTTYQYESQGHIPGSNCASFHQYLSDTTINGIDYSMFNTQVYKSSLTVFCDGYGTQSFIRNDTTNKKVFIYDAFNNKDTLLYDFNLNIGDTLKSAFANQGVLILSSIDSIQLGTNWYRRHNYTPDGFSMNAIIEGIGGENGFFTPLAGFEHSGFLKCYTENGIKKYPQSSYGQVGVCTWALNQQAFQEKEIQYSFQNNHLFIQDFKGAVSVYSVNGQKVLEKNVNANLSLSLDNLNPSIYFLKFQSEHQHKVDKIIVR